MKNIALLICAVLIFSVMSCGKKIEEAKQAMEMMKDMPKKAEEMQKSANLADQKREERKKRGDTLALPYKKLQEYLPKSVDGYGDAKLSGQQMNGGGFSF